MYQCHGSTTIINILILSNAGINFRRQILPSKVYLHTARAKLPAPTYLTALAALTAASPIAFLVSSVRPGC